MTSYWANHRFEPTGLSFHPRCKAPLRRRLKRSALAVMKWGSLLIAALLSISAVSLLLQ